MTHQPELMPEPTADELEGLSQRDVADVPADKWARSLVEFIEQIELTYLRDGMAADEAFRLACLAVRSLAEYRGGRQFYLPVGATLLTALRHAEVFRRANRANIEALAAEYELTVSQIYRICRQQHALHIRKTQGQFPFFKQGE